MNRKADKRLFLVAFFMFIILCLAAPPGFAMDKPNIFAIVIDDIGITNVSAYSMGLAGYQTPKLDRIAKEGEMFTGCI